MARTSTIILYTLTTGTSRVGLDLMERGKELGAAATSEGVFFPIERVALEMIGSGVGSAKELFTRGGIKGKVRTRHK